MAMPIRVLVVDDSAFARKVVREVLSRSPLIEVVGIARDGLDALEKAAELKPDVITVDLVMPNLDGLGLLQALPPGGPSVVVVSVTDRDSDLAVAALQAGAFDVVHKPTALATEQLYELADELQKTVIAAARTRGYRPPAARADQAKLPVRVLKVAKTRLIVIGASTGGPHAITRILRAMPDNLPVPIAVAVHMPQGFTRTFAKRLDADCALDVIEAYDGLELREGLAVVARAGLHLKIDRRGDGCCAALDLYPLDTAHHPSVDVLFESAANAFGHSLLGVVLTGMGDDGLKGARAIHAAGGVVLAEAESSCVVYGMPRCVIEAGLAAAAVRLDAMADAMLARL
jgi:two-component system, chemotaxis family, protein-glutamate methylesterase/glutaminase